MSGYIFMCSYVKEWEKMKKRKKIPDDILGEAVGILEELGMLKHTAIWQHEKVEEFINKYTEEIVEKMEWEEKEKLYKLADELTGRLYGSFKELKRVSGKYEELRERLEREYGDTRLPKVDKNEEELDKMWRELSEEEE